jgi:hypothetical protein
VNAIINWGIAVVLLGSVAALYRLCRPRAPRRAPFGFEIWDSSTQQWTAAQTAAPAPEADVRPGIDRAALDWIELTYSMPGFDRATDRLLDDIRNDTDGGNQ